MRPQLGHFTVSPFCERFNLILGFSLNETQMIDVAEEMGIASFNLILGFSLNETETGLYLCRLRVMFQPNSRILTQ